MLAAAAAGKSIICEKPLAMTVAEAEEMVAAVEKAGVPNLVCFNYRRVPAISLAKQLIDEGRIGRPFHYRATYLQDWTISADVPQGGAALWRLDAKTAGSGVTGDLLAHSIDTAEWLNGPIQSVVAKTETFVKQRHAPGDRQGGTGDDRRRLHVPGRVRQRLDGYVRKHALCPRPQELQHVRTQRRSRQRVLRSGRSPVPRLLPLHRSVTGKKVDDHLTGWQRVHVTNPEHPYMKKWWVPGCTIGYEHTFVHTVADYLQGIETGKPAQPDFRSGLRTQKVCDAVLASAGSGKWVDIA